MNDAMGLGVRPDAVPVMELSRAVLLLQLDKRLFLLVGHPITGAGEGDAHRCYSPDVKFRAK